MSAPATALPTAMIDREGNFLVGVKAVIAAFGVLLFLMPLGTPPGILAGLVGTMSGYLLARVATRRGLRLGAGLAIALVTIAAGYFFGQWIMDGGLGGSPYRSIDLSDAVFFGVGGLGVFFGLRMLSERARIFSILELVVVVGAVAHTFAGHRHYHINQPRFLSDWAWSRGIDPATVLEAAGVSALVLSTILLLRTRGKIKILLTLLALLLGGIAAYFLTRGAYMGGKPDADEMADSNAGKDKNDKDKNSSSSSGGRPPDPVAIVLLHDDLPDADVLYFREAVLSRFAVDRLVQDTSGDYDKDVISTLPAGKTVLTVDSPVNPDFHREIRTSMYLLVDHANLFGVAQPIEMDALINPDPTRFVAAYDVVSRFLTQEVSRFIGRTAMPAAWTDEQKKHYLAMPDDPRYLELSNKIVRDVDPRFVGDDLMKAFAIKRYLEQNGFYSLQEKQLVGNDPTAKFLFGKMRGYCVHFAHSAVLLFRSQGIPARVAVGYGVQTRRRGAGSSILIFGSDAHAWPEIYLDGVGWVTFDIYPEHSDEPPPQITDQDMESILGELARNNKTGGQSELPSTTFEIPWLAIGATLLLIVAAFLTGTYGIKLIRRLRRGDHRLVYRGVLDRLSDIGAGRQPGETRERHAARLAALAPSFTLLTREHLRQSFRVPAGGGESLAPLAGATRGELRRNVSIFKRLAGALNPIGWWFTR